MLVLFVIRLCIVGMLFYFRICVFVFVLVCLVAGDDWLPSFSARRQFATKFGGRPPVEQLQNCSQGCLSI